VITTLMPRLELGSPILSARGRGPVADAPAPLFELRPANAPCRMVHSRLNRCAPLARLLCRDLFPVVLR
jgi:hypothetical protein